MDKTLQHASTTSPEILVWEDPLLAPALGLLLPLLPEFPVLSPFANSRAPLTSWERRLRAISLTFQFLENKQPTSSIPNTYSQTNTMNSIWRKTDEPQVFENKHDFWLLKESCGHFLNLTNPHNLKLCPAT